MGFIEVKDDNKAYWSAKFRNYASVAYWTSFFIAIIFVLAWVILLSIVKGLAFREYQHPTALVGFFVHAFGGSLYFFSGYLQFNSSIRQNYPSFHRICGQVFYIMSIILFFGIFLILAGGSVAQDSSVIAVMTLFPYYMYCMYDSIVSIKRRDIARHRRMNIRCFVLANSIIWMRPAIIVLGAVTGGSPATSLKLAMWWILLWGYIAAEGFLYLEEFLRAEPIMYLKDGRSYFSNSLVPRGRGMASGLQQVTVSECELLNDNTLRIVLNAEDKAMALFFPGQHISLTHLKSDLCREFSPITAEDEAVHGKIQLWIRLVPNGAMAKILKDFAVEFALIIKKDDNKEVDEGRPSVPFPLLLSVSSSRLDYHPNQYKGLILVAAGTGLAPFINFITYVLNNKSDRTSIYLLYLHKNGTETIGLDMIRSIKANHKDTGTSQTRFEVDIRYTAPRIDASDIALIVSRKLDQNKTVFGSFHGDPTGYQLHLSGSVTFVKELHHACCKSTTLKLNENQLVSWGYSDR